VFCISVTPPPEAGHVEHFVKTELRRKKGWGQKRRKTIVLRGGKHCSNNTLGSAPLKRGCKQRGQILARFPNPLTASFDKKGLISAREWG